MATALKLPEHFEDRPQTILISGLDWRRFSLACAEARVEPTIAAYTNWRCGKPLDAKME